MCPRGTKRDTEPHAVIEGVEIHRYPLEAATGGPLGYVKEYGAALFHSLRLAFRAGRTGRFDVIHACNPPDLLFLVALPFKVRGTRFLFDHHDLVPELFESRFGGKGLLYKVSVVMERLTFAMADVVISTNESYREVAIRPRPDGARARTRGAQRTGPVALHARAAGPLAEAREAAPRVLPRRDGPAGRRGLCAEGDRAPARRPGPRRRPRRVHRVGRRLRRPRRAVAGAGAGGPGRVHRPGAGRDRPGLPVVRRRLPGARPQTRSTTSRP